MFDYHHNYIFKCSIVIIFLFANYDFFAQLYGIKYS